MNITDRLMALDKSLQLHNEGHWDKPYDPSVPGYTSFNDAGVETETGEFLWAMVRILKPKLVLETGTHVGVGAAYLASALCENKQGKLTTIEFIPELYNRAQKRLLEDLKLGEYVDLVFGDVKNYETKRMFQLIFLDTEPQTRFAELLKFYDNLEEGGYVFIHDLHRHMHQIPNEEHGFAWPYGKLPKDINILVETGSLRPIYFSTPRGLTGFYKVSRNDYIWKK